MVESLWNAVGVALLGTYPGLPFTPDGTPEGFSYYGSCAYDALNEVLDRLSCALQFDPLTDAFSIGQMSGTDTDTTAALTSNDGERLADAEWLESIGY